MRWLHFIEFNAPMSPRTGLFVARDHVTGKLAALHLVLALRFWRERVFGFNYDAYQAYDYPMYWCRFCWERPKYFGFFRGVMPSTVGGRRRV